MVKMKPRIRDRENYRSLLAMVTQARRRYCLPRGRKTVRSVSRRSQTPRIDRLDLQGVDGAVASFVETRNALRRQCELDGVGRWWREKQRKEKNDDDGVPAFITRSRHTETTRSSLSTPAWHQRWQRAWMERWGSSPTVRCRPRALFTEIIELPLVLKSQLLPNLCNNSKISKNKSCSKFKVLQLYFNNHTQIMSTFWNASLKSKGDTFEHLSPF